MAMHSPSLSPGHDYEDILDQQDAVLRAYQQHARERFGTLSNQRDIRFGQEGPDSIAASSPIRDSIDGTEPSTSPPKPVHEQLLDKGRIYAARKESLREEALRKEQKELRQKPTITSHGQRDRSNLLDRMQRYEMARQQELQVARDRAQEEEKRCSFHPRITRRAQRVQSRLHSDPATNWENKKQTRMDELRCKLRQEELEQVSARPTINERSIRLVEKRRQRELAAHGTTRGPHYTHADSLLERDRLSKLQLWEKYHHELQEQLPGNPKITEYAANLDRSHLGNAHDRLYDFCLDKEERRSRRQMTTDERECTHQPLITHTARAMRRELPVEEELLLRDDERRSKHEERMRRMITEERALHEPAINPVSDEIASQLPTTARERLYAAKVDRSLLRFAEEREEEERQRQQLQQQRQRRKPRSRSAPGSRPGGRAGGGGGTANGEDNFFLKMDRRKRDAGSRLELLREEHQRRQMEECTFTPAICDVNSSRRVNPLGIVERAEQWQQQREQKLQKERQRKVENELVGCTFAPTRGSVQWSESAPSNLDSVGTGRSPWRQAPETELYGGDGKAWGFDDFVERHRAARKQQMEKQEAFATGKTWRNQVTEPKEFRFGKSSRTSTTAPRSLQKPLEPPRGAWDEEPPHRQDEELLGLAHVGEEAGGRLPHRGAFSSYGSAAFTSAQYGVQPP